MSPLSESAEPATMFINPLNRKYSTIRKIVDRILSPEDSHHRGKFGGKASSLRGGSSSSSIQSSSSAGSFGSFAGLRRK